MDGRGEVLQNVTISEEEREEVRRNVRAFARRTPLIPLPLPLRVGRKEVRIFMKLESLQPIGSFKVRGGGEAVRAFVKRQTDGTQGACLVTASAGNMAQGMAYAAQKAGGGVRVVTVVPNTAPEAKLDRVRELGGEVVSVPMADWWQLVVSHNAEPILPDSVRQGKYGFVHPVADRSVVVGHATMAWEIVEQLQELAPDSPRVAAVVAPYGGGALVAGVAAG
eukprot:CAMPEP_0119145004 /NCGR_PEP_ID=MMETSP1310-20130426/36857_1 /TAXON_ID=464262 /ORGANISM="Genus nov. species nov., Strain RCC2339" /LENGTH=221 /DNA_ID=CAMNT_0007136791 /DNA_START=36 /DNA_END=697 /DNA_ORIENTATION=-